MKTPLKIKKIASPFLLLVYEEYPFDIFKIPNSRRAIGIAIFILTILNKLKTDRYITLEVSPSHSAIFQNTIDKIKELDF